MKLISAVIAGVALVCAAANPAMAQRGGRMGGMPPGSGPDLGSSAPNMGARAQQQMFRGITLTAAQQTQLQKLRADGRTQTQTLMKAARANREAVRTARENGDTVALNAARKQARGDANRRIALRGQLSKQVRGVLTPDQQKQFDANRLRTRERVQRFARGMPGRRGAMRGGAMIRRFGRGGGGRMDMRRGRGGFGPRGGFQMQRGRMQRGRGGMGPQGAHPDSTTSGGL